MEGKRHGRAKRTRRSSYKSACRNHLTEGEIREFQETFDLFDENGDGWITEAELRTCTQSFGLNYTEPELRGFIKEHDSDGNGVVDFEEYLDTVGNKTNGTDALSFDTIVSAFRCFDSNGDGVVDAAELRHCMATLGVKMADDEIDDMIELADVNCDGKINYNEFTNVMFSLEKRGGTKK